MNVMSTKIHGILDYLIALLMICTPLIMGFENNASEHWLIMAVGCFLLLYSFCTDYEFGYLEELDIRTHLLLDFLVGIVLILSPWLFGFYDKLSATYLYMVFGMIEITSTFFTKIDSQVFKNLSNPNKQRQAI